MAGYPRNTINSLIKSDESSNESNSEEYSDEETLIQLPNIPHPSVVDKDIEKVLSQSLQAININSELINSNLNNSYCANQNPEIHLNQLNFPIENTSNKMPLSNSDITELCKTLPHFSPGDNLTTFIKSVSDLLEFFESQEPSDIQKYIIGANLKSKLLGEARDLINLQNSSNWPEIKECLLKKYGDRRSEEILLTELSNTLQLKTDSYNDYYHKISKALNDLNLHVSLHETNDAIIEFKTKFFSNHALRVFVSGIREPYSTHLFHFELENIDEALQKCISLDNHNKQRNYMMYQIDKKEYKNNNSPAQISKVVLPHKNLAFGGNINKPLPARNAFSNGQVFGQRPAFSPNNQNQHWKQNQPNKKPFIRPSNFNYQPYQPNQQKFNNFTPQPMSTQTITRQHHNVELNADEQNVDEEIYEEEDYCEEPQPSTSYEPGEETQENDTFFQ